MALASTIRRKLGVMGALALGACLAPNVAHADTNLVFCNNTGARVYVALIYYQPATQKWVLSAWQPRQPGHGKSTGTYRSGLLYYFAEKEELPEDYSTLADVSDLIDSFSYPSLDDWRADTQANRIDRAIKCSSSSRYEHADFLRSLVFDLRDLSLEVVANQPLIIERAAKYGESELRMLEHIQKYRLLLPEDTNNELYIVDLTSFSQPARIDKKLIGLVDPAAKGYVEIKPVFKQGRKSHNVAVSLSLALNMQQSAHNKDMGEIVRILNLGDGHKGAAAGVKEGNSAHEFQRARSDLPLKILEIWKKM